MFMHLFVLMADDPPYRLSEPPGNVAYDCASVPLQPWISTTVPLTRLEL